MCLLFDNVRYAFVSFRVISDVEAQWRRQESHCYILNDANHAIETNDPSSIGSGRACKDRPREDPSSRPEPW